MVRCAMAGNKIGHRRSSRSVLMTASRDTCQACNTSTSCLPSRSGKTLCTKKRTSGAKRGCVRTRPGGVCALTEPSRNWTGAPRSPQRTWAEKDGAKPPQELLISGRGSVAASRESVRKNHGRPTYPDFLHGAPPTPACAAFIKESRMKCANASKLDRKSGVR